MDGIDAALIRSDGVTHVETGAAITTPYDEAFRAELRGVMGGRGEVGSVERDLTLRHAAAVEALLAAAGSARAEIAVVGFQGQTILHAPAESRTWQIGDGALLAAKTGIDVVADFRSQDVASGGQGAPLAPLYHAALAMRLERPLAVLNLGGVGNVTWIGAEAGQVIAFDTGPANALIDDWVQRQTGESCDRDGALAAAGRVDEGVLQALLTNAYFDQKPPKSLDRDAFDPAPVASLAAADGAATLTAFTAATVARALIHLPEPPRRWLVAGGGRHNPSLMKMLARNLQVPVEPVEAVGWDGDALEAQAFAYLALRSLQGRPLSLPGTTGVPQPTGGGVLYRAA